MSKAKNKNENKEDFEDTSFLEAFEPKPEESLVEVIQGEHPIKTSHRKTSAELAASNQPVIIDESLQPGEKIITIDPKLIDKNPYQNRYHFNKRKIAKLADKIKSAGQLSPCIVRQVGSRYQLAAGERRWRACTLAQIPIQVIVRDIGNEMMRTICHAENEDREDTSMVEKFLGIRSLISEEGKSREEAIGEFKMSQTTYSRISKIENLPDDFIHEFAESAYSVRLNPYRLEEIGKLFRDNEEFSDQFLEMLRNDIENFSFLEFDSDHEEQEEANKTAVAFVKKAKGLIKPASGPRVSEKPKDQEYEYLIDGRVVGTAKLNSRSFSLKFSKEDLPQDLMNKLVSHIETFFKEKEMEAVDTDA
jgi:ParB/RepB/Spo0J family partition protein